MMKAEKPDLVGGNLDDDDVFNALFPERVWQAKANAFFSLHPVFRREEFVEEYVGTGHSQKAAGKVLEHYVRRQRVRNVRRHLYVVENVNVDPLLYASRITTDAVLAYASALTFHTKWLTTDLWPVIARLPARIFTDSFFRCRVIAKPDKEDRGSAVQQERLHGVTVRVTRLERTLVDLLDRPDLGPSFEELLFAFCDNAWNVDPSVMAAHAERINSSVCAARLGLMLQTHRRYRAWGTTLRRLNQLRPTTPACAVPGIRQECFVQGRWNLVLPRNLFRRISARSGEGWNDRIT